MSYCIDGWGFYLFEIFSLGTSSSHGQQQHTYTVLATESLRPEDYKFVACLDNSGDPLSRFKKKKKKKKALWESGCLVSICKALSSSLFLKNSFDNTIQPLNTMFIKNIQEQC